MSVTYHRSLEALRVFLQLLESIRFIFRSFDDCTSILCSNIFENALQLILGRWVFSHFKLELWSVWLGLVRVIACLVLGSMLSRAGRDLLQKSVNSD